MVLTGHIYSKTPFSLHIRQDMYKFMAFLYINSEKDVLCCQLYLYRQELLNNLFNHPYTKIDFVMEDLAVSRITAPKYLDELVGIGLLDKTKVGRSNFYINTPLMALFLERA